MHKPHTATCKLRPTCTLFGVAKFSREIFSFKPILAGDGYSKRSFALSLVVGDSLDCCKSVSSPPTLERRLQKGQASR